MLFLKYLPELSENELTIYNYISQNIEKVIYMSIRELAEALHFSKSTIWRFCQKFECDGYSEFKVRLKAHLNEKQLGKPFADIDESILINFLKRASSDVIEERIEVGAELLAESEMVIFLGEGTSKVIAQYGEIYFSSLFNMSFSISHPLFHPSSRITKETAKKICVVAISVSGLTDKVLRNVTMFKEMGIKTISITNSDKNTLASLSDVNIPYFITTNKNNTADVTTQVPALFLIEKLAKSTAKKLSY
ncbi:MAG: MurR/RpiR family transcriptional regulator [Turicibacter sp.]|nr:MurR/RpiR family transcriptional regulator [Turicibacter sp.]